MDCPVFLAYKEVDMIVFGLDKNRKIISPENYASIDCCFQSGCFLYNSNVVWIAYTGKCD